MRTTYTIQKLDIHGCVNIVGYFTKLYDAKAALIAHYVPGEAEIIKLIGPEFGEGFHAYYLTHTGSVYNGVRFKRNKKSIFEKRGV